MRTKLASIVAATLIIGTAAAQEVGEEPASPANIYWGVGIQVGGGIEYEKEVAAGDTQTVDAGGYGAYARLGRRFGPILGLEAEGGFAGFEGDGTLIYGAAYVVATAPLGPVDLRARGGLALQDVSGTGAFGPALGLGGGFRVGESGSVRFDTTVMLDSFSDGDDTDAAQGVSVLLQVGYRRSF